MTKPSFADCYNHLGNVEQRILDVVVRCFANLFGVSPLERDGTMRLYCEHIDRDAQQFAEDAARRLGDGVVNYGLWNQVEAREMPPEAYCEAVDGSTYCSKDLQNGHNTYHMREAARNFREAGMHLLAEMRDRATVPCPPPVIEGSEISREG